ncbi:MAG: hypothetical protein ACHQ51_01600 [Elusimicrobiota bacterium]
MIPLAAVLVMSLSGLASAQPAPAGPAADAPDPYAQALAKARQAYLTHAQRQPTLDTVVKLPAKPAPEQAQKDAEVRNAIDAAKEVQLGCDLPCSNPADIQLYRAKVELVAGKLGLKGADVAAARENYLPKEQPRLRDPRGARASGEANQEAERIAMARILANAETAPAIRAQLNRKALTMADALGKTQLVTMGNDGVAVFAGGQRRMLTAQQIADINARPKAQAEILRHLATNPPPSPLTQDQKQQKVLSDAEQSIKDNPGRVRQAQNFWVTESQDKNSNPLWRGYAYFNRGLLAVSGLGEVEDSAARVGYVSVSDDVSTGRKAWEVTKLAGNSAMFAANFVGIGGASKVVKGVQVFEKPVVVDGIRAVGKETAQLVTEHSGQVAEALKPALATGGRDFKAATKALDEMAQTQYGGAFKVVRGKYLTTNAAEKIAPGMAEWVAKDSKIIYNPLVGEAHEFAHAHQMFVTRGAALDLAASQAGKTVAELSPKEVGEALKLAERFEQANYAKYEAQALRSSGFLGLTPGSNYTAKLAANGREITQAMLANPEWKFSTGQKVFGSLSGLGHSQVEIGMSLLPVFNIPLAREGIVTVGTLATDALTPDAAAAPQPAGSGAR